jgi:hypothetical protein
VPVRGKCIVPGADCKPPKRLGRKNQRLLQKSREMCNRVRRPPHRDPSNLISPTPIVVVEIVAVKALWNHSEPQCSIRRPQRIQSKSLIFTQFQQISTCRRIWFGTRFPTLNSSLRISELRRSDCGIWGSVGILQVQFRLQSAISRISPRTDLPQFVSFSNSGGGGQPSVFAPGV